MRKQTGKILAAAVGAIFATASFAAGTTTNNGTAEVKCAGANACKGQGACKSADNSCKGQNACKGKGWIMTATEKECTDKGGKVQK